MFLPSTLNHFGVYRDFSMMRQLRPSFNDAMSVEPLPPNGSSTKSPRLVSTLMYGISNSNGLVPKITPDHWIFRQHDVVDEVSRLVFYLSRILPTLAYRSLHTTHSHTRSGTARLLILGLTLCHRLSRLGDILLVEEFVFAENPYTRFGTCHVIVLRYRQCASNAFQMVRRFFGCSNIMILKSGL